MDFGTKVRVAVALLLFRDALFRLLFANIRLPAIPAERKAGNNLLQNFNVAILRCKMQLE